MSAEMRVLKCKGCVFFDIQNGQNLGSCRRYTPKVFANAMGNGFSFMAAYPQVDPNLGWCGEGSPKLTSSK